MIWAEKVIPFDQREALQNVFDDLLGRLGPAEDMMMVSADTDRRTTERLIISVPDERALGLFEGFSPIQEASLPKTARLVVGIQTAFEERFSLPR
jgi:hypothetical protein